MTNATPLEIRAEWPGRVAEVHVTDGSHVAEGDALVTLEAMKMLTAITAPRDGEVESVAVEVDAFVEQGALLARLR